MQLVLIHDELEVHLLAVGLWNLMHTFTYRLLGILTPPPAKKQVCTLPPSFSFLAEY